MKADKTAEDISFLQGGGEMGRLMREKDWSNTILGEISTWPATLKIALGIMLHSKFPMLVMWGADLICFYNDAFRPSLGEKGKHPEMLGGKGEIYWSEIWHIIHPLLLQAMNEGIATWSEDRLIPIFRNGKVEEVYWTFSYSRISDENGQPAGVFVTCYETTSQVIAHRKLEESEDQLKFTIDAAELGTWDLNPFTNKFVVNQRLRDIFSLPAYEEIELEQALRCIDPKDVQRVRDAIAYALNPVSGGRYDIAFRIHSLKDNQEKKLSMKGKALFNESNEAYRFSGILQDITDRTVNEEILANLAAIVESSEDAIISKTLDGIITSWNSGAEKIFGFTAREMTGQSIEKIFPPELLKEEAFILSRIKSGERLKHFETQRITKNGERVDISITVSPILDQKGSIIGISKIARDITQQKLSEKKISESEERLQIVVEASDQGTWELDLITGAFTYSARYLQMLGYKEHKSIPYQQLVKHIHPDDLAARQKAIEEAYLTGKIHYVSRVRWNDGSIHWIEARGKVFYNDQGNPVRMIGTSRDLTDEMNHQRRLEESEHRLRIAALSSELGTWNYDLTTNNLTWDNATRELFGIPLDAPVTIDLFWSKIHPDDIEETYRRMHNALDPAIASTYDMEYRVTGLPGNQLRWIHAKGKAFFNHDGKPYVFAGTVLDVTEKRKALDELQENEQKFRLLADSMPQMVWTADQEGYLNYANRSAYEYTALGSLGRLDQEWLHVIHPADRHSTLHKLEHAISSGQPFLIEHRIRRHDGEYRWHISRAFPQKASSGITQTWVFTSSDIHDRKLFIDALETEVQERTKLLTQSNEQLLRMNDELAQFAYVASHDLQEPLRKIQTFSSLLLDAETASLSEKGKMYFDRIQKASGRMQQLIVDLLSYSRTSTSEKQFIYTPLDNILRAVLENLRETIESSGAFIKAAHLPSMYVVPFQFEQLFTNLLSNAIKFARPGVRPEIGISVSLVGAGSLQHPAANPVKKYYLISVKDNGIGFDPRYKEKIFQVFQRLHNIHEYPGTGIGLAICKKIAENHGGFMDSSSEPGVGSQFDLYIPEI